VFNPTVLQLRRQFWESARPRNGRLATGFFPPRTSGKTVKEQVSGIHKAERRVLRETDFVKLDWNKFK